MEKFLELTDKTEFVEKPYVADSRQWEYTAHKVYTLKSIHFHFTVLVS